MTQREDRYEDEALGWVIRLKTADAADWDAFAAWAAGDPARADAYWLLAAADAELGETLAREPDDTIGAFRARPGATVAPGWWALAASILIAVLGYGTMTRMAWFRASQPYAIETAAGETRTLMLADGSRVALNGSTRLLLDHADPRAVRIDRGEAFFSVVHDAGHPFAVQAGEARLRDLGTRFDVVRDGEGLRVAVAEGAVRFEQAGAARDLHAGDTLSVVLGEDAVAGHADPADAGSWTRRRLVYDGAPIALVAADIARSTGATMAVSPAVAGRRFSGSFGLGADGADTIARAAAIMDLRAVRQGSGWILLDAASPPR